MFAPRQRLTLPLLAAALCAAAGCAKPQVGASLAPDQVLVYRTPDGWELDLRHYPGEGPPVLLVHGMGANHYNWDFRPEVSFAYYLHQQGWDVWVPELRGDMGARAPDRKAAKNFTFDDHARLDLPAAVDAVLAETGEPQLFWVGHSMGGMLLYAALAQFPERITAGVTIGAPANFRDPNRIHNAARRAGWLVPRRGRLANNFWYTVSRVFGDRNPIYTVLSNKENLDWPVTRGLGAVALEDMSRPTVKQVHLWLREGEFTDVEGHPWVRPPDEPVPMLVVAGSVDKVAVPSTVAAACDVYEDCEFVLAGRETGFSTDYGHIDPVVGATARGEIYPLVSGFLAEHLPSGVTLAPPDDGWSPIVEEEPVHTGRDATARGPDWRDAALPTRRAADSVLAEE
ncbi:MAG: alpha/beta fold hydrolase [Alphaproteobacteria bacterium]|nr:alpha/beta fold hydrolase [Alphaproteobacteria bacterium]